MKDFLAEKGYDPQFGARPLKRAIQKYLEDEMAEIIIKLSISEGDTISVGFDKKNEKLLIRILSPKKMSNNDTVVTIWYRQRATRAGSLLFANKCENIQADNSQKSMKSRIRYSLLRKPE